MDEDFRGVLAGAIDSATAEELAAVYDDEPVYPNDLVIEEPHAGNFFPEWDGSVLLISHENQGVCSWGLSLDGPQAGAILVGGDLVVGNTTVVYASNISEFVAGRRWDGRCLNGQPLLQAQANELDELSLEYLNDRFTEGLRTFGWPCERNYRFAGSGLLIMLWACADQCDWWISGSESSIAASLPELRQLSDLSQTLWSNDEAGTSLLGMN
jgi:hypothetical protein